MLVLYVRPLQITRVFIPPFYNQLFAHMFSVQISDFRGSGGFHFLYNSKTFLSEIHFINYFSFQNVEVIHFLRSPSYFCYNFSVSLDSQP